jgi:tight adherence protein B
MRSATTWHTAMIVGASIAAVVLLASTGSLPAARRPATRLRAAGSRSVPDHAALVDAIERTARDVRSGVALRVALVDALQRHPGLLVPVVDELGRGASLHDALTLPMARPNPDTEFVLHGLRLAADTGGATAETLDRVVGVVRERQVWRGERYAQAAQARLSARMLTVLPIAVAGWSVASGPRVRQAYADSPVTGALAIIGVLLNLTGWWWMRRLVRGPAAS